LHYCLLNLKLKYRKCSLCGKKSGEKNVYWVFLFEDGKYKEKEKNVTTWYRQIYLLKVIDFSFDEDKNGLDCILNEILKDFLFQK